MRTIAYIVPTFWIRGSGKKLRGDDAGIVLALYLMTAPQSSQLGLYTSSLAQIGNALGWSVEKVRETFTRITEIARYDEEAELVWVPATLRYQVGDEMNSKDYRRGPLERELRMFGDHEFVSEFLDLYAESHGISRPGSSGARGSNGPAGREEKTKKGGGGGKGQSPARNSPSQEHQTAPVASTLVGLSEAPDSPLPNPPPIPTPSPPDPLGDARGASTAKIGAAEFKPGSDHKRVAQELGLTEKNIKSALVAFRKKVKKKATYADLSQIFLNFLRSEKSDNDGDQENPDYDPDAPAKPSALFWYEHHRDKGEHAEAEKYRLRCVKQGLLKGEN